LADYEFTGRMRITDPSGGIGVTFLSQYPNADVYYRLRRYLGNAFHIASHGTTVSGVTDSGVVPQANQWYRFLIRVEDTGGRTEIRARIWADGTAEPSVFQIDAFDDSGSRITSGTVGVWSFRGGEKHWDDLEVAALDAPAPMDLVLTTSVVGDGTIDVDPDQVEYTEGQQVTLTATPGPGHLFTGWSGDLSGLANPEALVMVGDRSVTASFGPLPQHTLTLTAVGPGQVTVSPMEATYDLGAVVTLTAAPDPGNRFTGWTGDLTGVQNPALLTITGDLAVTGSFDTATTLLSEDFETLVAGEDPSDWLDTGPGNSLTEDDALFGVFDFGSNLAFGTADGGSNIHSHYVGAGAASLANYEFTGRMRITNPNGGIGVTFLSQYPNADVYYRLRRYSGNAFHIASHGTTVSGVTDSGVVPQANQWYRFRIRVEDIGSQTEILATVWPDGAAEPGAWQIDAFDDSPSRITSGTIGAWSSNGGEKHWDDLEVAALDAPAPAPQAIPALSVLGLVVLALALVAVPKIRCAYGRP
jgi:hypothetical protein